MPYDSEGNFTRMHNWEDDRINDIDIVTDHHDEEDDNFAEALNQCFLRDGRSPMKADINAAGFKIKNLADGVLAQDAVTRKQLIDTVSELQELIKTALGSSAKLGDIKVSLQTADHDNWLLCHGQEVSREDYADLFALIGTDFGPGDGINTFNIPDYRGKFLRGLGGASAEDMHTTQDEGLPNITGNIGLNQNLISNSSENSALYATFGSTHTHSSSVSSGAQSLFLDASRANKIYGASEHVTPVNQAVNFFIKAKVG